MFPRRDMGNAEEILTIVFIIIILGINIIQHVEVHFNYKIPYRCTEEDINKVISYDGIFIIL